VIEGGAGRSPRRGWHGKVGAARVKRGRGISGEKKVTRSKRRTFELNLKAQNQGTD
jgi:hypothetical protein